MKKGISGEFSVVFEGMDSGVRSGQAGVQRQEPPNDPLSFEYAVFLLFTNKIIECEKAVEPFVEKDPRKALLYGLCSFFSAVSSYGEGALDEALNRFWKAESIAKNLGTVEGTIYRGFGYLLGACVQFIQESYTKGAWNVKNSWGYFKQASKALEKYDGDDKEEIKAACDIGIGLFNMLLSLLPPSVVSVVEWLGFSGDRALALHLLDSSFKSNSCYSPFASLFLLSFYVNISEQIGDYNPAYRVEADKIFSWADENYPNGILFSSLACRYFRGKGELDKAILVANEGIENCIDLPGYKMLFFYNRGWCNFLKKQWNEAIYDLKQLLDNHKNFKTNWQASYVYMIGICQSMMGNANDSFESFKSIPSYQKSRMRPIDGYIKRKAEYFVAGKGDALLESCEMISHFGAFAHMDEDLLKEYKEALSSAAELKEAQWDQNNFAKYHVACSYIAFHLGAYKECISHGSKAISAEKKLDSHGKKDGILAHAFFMLSKANLELKEIETAQQFFLKADGVKDYELIRIMKFRLHALKHNIQLQKDQAKE